MGGGGGRECLCVCVWGGGIRGWRDNLIPTAGIPKSPRQRAKTTSFLNPYATESEGHTRRVSRAQHSGGQSQHASVKTKHCPTA